MKRILLILLVVFPLLTFGQFVPKITGTIQDATTPFVTPISAGSTVINLVTGTAYICITAATGSETLTTASAKFQSPGGYTHPTGDGNLHVPATSTTNNGKVLTAGSSAGSLSWEISAGGVTGTDSTKWNTAATQAGKLVNDSTKWNLAADSAMHKGRTEIVTGTKIMSNITLPTNGQVKMTVPTTDGHATGPTTGDFQSGYSSTAVGDLVYLDSSSKWQKCDKGTSAATYSGLLGIALEVKAANNAVLVALPGSFVYATGFPSLTVGSPVYMDDAGAIVVTSPTTADHVVRMIGWAVHADKIYFFPSPDYVMYQ
jgi:hypothetical protein